MKVLVIGGTGIIGTGIVEAAVDKHHDVYDISRQKNPIHNNSLPVKYLQADWYDKEQASKVIDGMKFDVVVDGLVFNENQLKRDLGLLTGKCQHFIYISTAGVYNQPILMANEDSPKDIDKLVWNYSVYKRRAEIYLESHYDEYNFMISTVRPPFTYGDTRIPCAMVGRRNQWTLLDRIIKGVPIVFIEDGGSIHAVTHISTFSEAVVGLFMNQSADRQMFHVSDDNAYSWDFVINTVGDILGKQPLIVHVPIETVKPCNRALYDEIKYNKLESLTLDNKKIRSAVPDVNYSVPLKDGLSRTVKFLESEYSTRLLDTEFDKLSDFLLLKYGTLVSDGEECNITQNYISGMSADETSELNRWAKEASKVVQREQLKKDIKGTIKKILGK
ncbi:MAG: NAD-dependent epimerase/dehydratase family protein [Ruminococcus sp.]|nr:NAD-dependent epimerase/dehydratase family protein [Ruminococcus sp.]